MQWRTTLILLGVVLAAAGLLYLDETRWSAARSDAEAADKAVFPGVEAAEITGIELRTEGGEVAQLEREEGGWRLLAPVEFPADPVTVDALASGLAELISEAVYDGPEALEEYGLAGEPLVRFRVGEREHALRIGDKTPVGSNTYVTDASGERVFAVPTWRTNPMRKELRALRDARVLVFDREGLDGMQLEWPGGKVSLRKGEEGWVLIEPLEAAADADTVEGLISDLFFLRAESFVDEAPSEQALATLDAPAFRALLKVGQQDAGVELVVGATSDGERRLVRGRDGILFEIGQARVDELPRRVADYRFKELARFASADAQAFQLDFQAEGESEAVRLDGSRNETGWSVEPEAMAPGKASRLVSELSDLEAVDIAAEEMGPEELSGLGLSPPRVVLQVNGKGDAALARIELGELQPGRGIAARRDGDPVVYWLEESLAEHLPVSLEAYRNRFASQESEPAPEAAAAE